MPPAFELTPAGSGWTESVLHSFLGGGSDGANPFAGLTMDNAGNLYGTTSAGGSSNGGTVFQLVHSTGWTKHILYSFQGGNDGSIPYAGVIFDHSGNLYGATSYAGAGGGGTAFQLSPSGGGWTYSLLYSFGASCGIGPDANLVMDGAGDLYGTTFCGGANQLGAVFELAKAGSGWTYISLHDFTGSDGIGPIGVTFDVNGNLTVRLTKVATTGIAAAASSGRSRRN